MLSEVLIHFPAGMGHRLYGSILVSGTVSGQAPAARLSLRSCEGYNRT